MQGIAIAVVLLGFIGFSLMILSRRAPKSVASGLPVPPALKPGDVDDVLETDRLDTILRWGAGLTVFMAVFLVVYWWIEPQKRVDKEEFFNQQSLDRGRYYYAMKEDPVTGEHPPRGVGHPAGDPIECARCHGVDAEGGENDFLDPATGERRKVKVPELRTVFSRYAKPPPGFRDARAFIRETIERGRPGTDMPTWGNRFGGPLTDQQIDDITNWLFSIQGPLEVAEGADGASIFNQNCAPCHGIGGAGASGPALTGGSEVRQFPNIDDHIAFVVSGSSPNQPYGTSGRGTGGMPGWKGRLTDEQIRLVVEYERSL